MSKRRFGLALLLSFAAPLATLARAQDGPPRETRPTRPPDLVEVARLDPTIHLDVRYARADNFLGRAVYPASRVFLERPAAEAVARVHRALAAQGYGLLLFDGYRPWSVTKLFWDATPPDKRAFVADPAKGSKHNRGCAIDLTLYELATGREVEMPSAYDEMSERAYPTYEGGSAASRERRDLLRRAMEQEGFFVYSHEWWHFDYRDWLEYPILDLSFAEIDAAAAKRVAPTPTSLDLRSVRIVDLTHDFDETTLYWPTSPSTFELEKLHYGKTDAGFFYASFRFCTPEHGGTHLDAPVHFAEGQASVEAVPLERLIGPAVVIDVGAAVASDPDYRLAPADIKRWEEIHGSIPAGAIVLLRTGFGPRWPDRKRYFGDDTPGDASHLHFPSYGAEAVALLVRERSVAAIGVDTASIDHGPSTDFPVHRLAAAAGVPGLENLARLDELPETGAVIVALPMKIRGGSGGPLRAVALLPR